MSSTLLVLTQNVLSNR